MIRVLLLALTLTLTAPAHAGTTADEDWSTFGHILTLMESALHAGMAPDGDRAMADMLAGRDPKANGAIAGLFAGATAGMPAGTRDRLAALGRDIAGYAAQRRAAAGEGGEDALQARKDLNAMGLRYYDPKQFLDAAKRDDALAVELFVAGRGVDLGAKTWDGRSALDIARANGNARLAELLSRNLPPTR